MPSRQINRRPPGPEDPRHGQYRGYIAGCRLECCVKAERAYQNEMSRKQAYGIARKVPAVKPLRQLQSLMALGWSGEYLAERLGVRRPNLLPRFQTVRAGYAAKVQSLFDELKHSEGPSTKTRRRAEKSGWSVPKGYKARSHEDLLALVRRAEELGTPPAVTQRYLKISPATYAGLREETA